MEPPETDPRPLARFCLQSGLLPPDIEFSAGNQDFEGGDFANKLGLQPRYRLYGDQISDKKAYPQRVFEGFQEPHVFAV